MNLTGSNNYSGPTALAGGMLQAGAANALSPNSAVTISGGTLAATGFSQTVKSLSIASSGAVDLTIGDALTSSGAANLGGTLNLQGSSGTADLINYLSYSGSFAVTNLPVGYTLQYTASQLDLVPITSTTYNLAATAAASSAARRRLDHSHGHDYECWQRHGRFARLFGLGSHRYGRLSFGSGLPGQRVDGWRTASRIPAARVIRPARPASSP